MSRHRPPQPPRGVYPTSNRLLEPIPSVPELQAYRDKLLAYVFLRGLDGGLDDGWYSVMRELERAEQALDDARWRLACESWKWTRWDEQYRGACRERAIWAGMSLCQAWRYEGIFSSPGRTLVLRSKAQVVA